MSIGQRTIFLVERISMAYKAGFARSLSAARRRQAELLCSHTAVEIVRPALAVLEQGIKELHCECHGPPGSGTDCDCAYSYARDDGDCDQSYFEVQLS